MVGQMFFVHVKLMRLEYYHFFLPRVAGDFIVAVVGLSLVSDHKCNWSFDTNSAVCWTTVFCVFVLVFIKSES